HLIAVLVTLFLFSYRMGSKWKSFLLTFRLPPLGATTVIIYDKNITTKLLRCQCDPFEWPKVSAKRKREGIGQPPQRPMVSEWRSTGGRQWQPQPPSRGQPESLGYRQLGGGCRERRSRGSIQHLKLRLH